MYHENICHSYLNLELTRGVSGFLKLGGGQVVMQVVMRRGTVAGGAFYSAKKWGGQLPPLPSPSLTPLSWYNCLLYLDELRNCKIKLSAGGQKNYKETLQESHVNEKSNSEHEKKQAWNDTVNQIL